VEADRLRSKLATVDWKTDPFRYFYLENVFSDEFYAEILFNLPDLSRYRKYGGPYKLRYLYTITETDTFWSKIDRMFRDVYGDNIRVQLCKDLPGYSIGPHTDGKEEFSTVLFYLPKYADKQDHGTTVYAPKGKNFTSDGTKHLAREKFDVLFTAQFKPNTAFGFIRSDNSFHGVEPTTKERDLIQVSVWR
jgi:hypothetical protein